MSYCVNPDCPQPKNPIDAFLCQACGARLLVRNRYRVTKSLGQGGFGATFVAIDVSLPGEPICVIKQLRPSNNHEKFLRMARELFEREARTLGKIGNHPQIPRLLDFFEERRNFYLVQEYVSGHTIHQEVKQSGLFKEDKIRTFLTEILPVINYIHSQQVIHRDIKPANILRRDQDGKLVLIDFGAVKNHVAQIEQPEGGEPTHNTQFAVGTSGYAPPEQLAMRPIFASDIYALGVTCIYLMTGKSPKDIEYNPSTGEMMWQKHVQLSKQTAQVLGKMLDVSVRYRYQSAEEVLRALDGAIVVEARPTAPPPRPGDSPAQPQRLGQPGLPPNPNKQPLPVSSPNRIAETIKKQRLERDPTSIRNGGAQTGLGGNPQTGFGGAPVVQPPRQQLKLDAQGVLAAFRRGQRVFSELDINGLDLSKSHLPGITLSSANCAYINFQGANLSSGKFDKADLSGAVFKDAVLIKGYFSYANLQNADLRGADLSDAYLNYANLHGANLCGANLKGVKVTEDQLNQAKTNFMTVFPNGKRGGFW